MNGPSEDFSLPLVRRILLKREMLEDGRQQELEVLPVRPAVTGGYQKHFWDGRVLLCRRSDTRWMCAKRLCCSTPACLIICEMITEISAEYSTLSMQKTIPLQISWFSLSRLYIIGEALEQVD